MNTKFTYIQFPLFILRKAHEDFDLMAEYILAYGIHQKSLKESVSGSKPFSMTLGLEYLTTYNQVGFSKRGCNQRTTINMC